MFIKIVRIAVSILFCFLQNPLPDPNTKRSDSLDKPDYASEILGQETAVEIAVGSFHTCALTDGGELLCWGHNEGGEVGDGSAGNIRIYPAQVVGIEDSVISVSASDGANCAVTDLGGVKCWGGRFGYDKSDIPGLEQGVSDVRVAPLHECVLLESGGVQCWGNNDFGQLGIGSDVSWSNVPVDVVGLQSGVVDVSVGYHSSCALLLTGEVKCWGTIVGDGTEEKRTSPVTVTEIGNNGKSVAVGTEHTCVALKNGTVKCWGKNGRGQLGDGTTTHRYSPVDVVGLGGIVTSVAAGGGYAGYPRPDQFTCAVFDNGIVKCWGGNFYGQLGIGNFIDQSSPVEVLGLSGVNRIGLGMSRSCAVLEHGGIRCWGYSGLGQNGNGDSSIYVEPEELYGLENNVKAVRTSYSFSCAITLSGGVKCWGDNSSGQLGDGTNLMYRLYPVDVIGLSSGVKALALGGYFACAVTESDEVFCWGDNAYYQLGNAYANNFNSTPTKVAGLTGEIQGIYAGFVHVCVLLGNGGLKCWGNNESGQLGNGRVDFGTPTPGDVIGLESGVTQIPNGGGLNCVTINEGVKCWGPYFEGVILTSPVDINGLTSGVKKIETSGSHLCALLLTGAVKCWGLNAYGQIGDGTTERSSTPVDIPVLGTDVRDIFLGLAGQHTCAVMKNGQVKCWGHNGCGQVGVGTMRTEQYTPTDAIVYSGSVQSISMGWYRTCILNQENSVRCLGDNSGGAIGNGRATSRSTPVSVRGFGQDGLTILGAVWDGSEPLSGVTATIDGNIRVETTAEGRFFFHDLPPGSYTLHLSEPGYTFPVLSVSIPPDYLMIEWVVGTKILEFPNKLYFPVTLHLP